MNDDPAVEAPLSDEPMLDAATEETRQTAFRTMAAAKPVPPIALDELLDLDTQGQFLSLNYRSKQPHLEQLAIPIKGWPGYCLSQMISVGDSFNTVNLNHWHFEQPDVTVNTYMSSTVGHVQLGVEMESQSQRLQVRLIQNIRDPATSETDSEVRFTVRLTHTDCDGNEVILDDITATARSFDQLSREHGELIRTWLGDLFSRLGQPLLLRGGIAKARHVLHHEPNHLSQIEQQVADLVKQLDAPRAVDRAQARRQLVDLGTAAQQAMLRLSPSTLSPEQQQTIEELTLGASRVTDDEIARLASDIDYLLDIINTRDAELRQLAAARLRFVSQDKIRIDPQADSPTRFAQVRQVREQRSTTTQTPTTQLPTTQPPTTQAPVTSPAR